MICNFLVEEGSEGNSLEDAPFLKKLKKAIR
jgi:hypothetical protein